MNRQTIPLLMLVVLLTHHAVAESAQDQPNILFIAVDDLRPSIGCYGDELAITPNMDRLADNGLVFNRAYCQVAVCNPSRASLMTGQRPDHLGVWTLPIHFREANPLAVTMPQWFRKYGYTAVSHGKIYHNPTPDPQSWSEPIRDLPDLPFPYPDGTKEMIEAAKKKLPKNDWRKNNLRPPCTSAPDLPDSELIDGARTDMAIEDLQRLSKEEEPFFLAMGYIRPHLAWVAPKKYWDMYDPDKLPVLIDESVNKDTPKYALHNNSELSHYVDLKDMPKPWDKETLSPEQSRKMVHGYYACVSYVDAQLGRILDALDESGVADETIIVLWSDHGYKLGEYRGWGKMTNYEIDTRVPLIISTPAMRSGGSEVAGTQTESLAELLDLFPTLCELSGIEVPKFVDGKSLAPVLEDPESQVHDAAVSQYYRKLKGKEVMGYALRTDDHRFVEWRDFSTGEVVSRELYDHRSDPEERINIAASADEALLDSLTETLLETHPRKGLVMTPLVHSTAGSKSPKVEMSFVNDSAGDVKIIPITSRGARNKRSIKQLKSGEQMTRKSRVGEVFVVESDDGKIYEIHSASFPSGKVVIEGNDDAESKQQDPETEEPSPVVDDSPKVIDVQLIAGANGELESITVAEEKTFSGDDRFKQLAKYFDQKFSGMDETKRKKYEVQFQISPELKYHNTVKAIEAVSGGFKDDGSVKKFVETIRFKDKSTDNE